MKPLIIPRPGQEDIIIVCAIPKVKNATPGAVIRRSRKHEPGHRGKSSVGLDVPRSFTQVDMRVHVRPHSTVEGGVVYRHNGRVRDRGLAVVVDWA